MIYALKSNNFSFYSRKKSLGLIIALDDNGQATGDLFWDDGESRGGHSEMHVAIKILITEDNWC